ncbi:MAG: MerR family transcriptional regulator [Coprobacillaceae bacterium]
MCTMKQACDKLGITYETLRFYCDEGLVPNVKRDKNNYRDFDENNLTWINGLQCLRQCGMSIKDMKKYLQLCLEGKESIPDRKVMLQVQKEILMKKAAEIQESMDYIDNKQVFYNEVLSGEREYTSALIKTDKSS